MKFASLAITFAAATLASQVFAAGDLTKTDITTVTLEMGSNGAAMYFNPNHFDFETGRAYKMVLKNVDNRKHELDMGELPNKVFTRKVEVKDDAGKLVAEIKGSVHEMEVGAGKSYEWFFVPLQPIKNAVIDCSIPGHKEAGMTGTVTIN